MAGAVSDGDEKGRKCEAAGRVGVGLALEAFSGVLLVFYKITKGF